MVSRAGEWTNLWYTVENNSSSVAPWGSVYSTVSCQHNNFNAFKLIQENSSSTCIFKGQVFCYITWPLWLYGHVHTQWHGLYGKMSCDFFAVRPSESQNLIASSTWACSSRTVDVAFRHVWKLRLYFIFYYLMRHESYGHRMTDVAMCERALRFQDSFKTNIRLSIVGKVKLFL
jgi:hypothetical protein